VIDRAQVTHVARLARLGLDEAEVESMPAELSTILEHIDRIAELDLDRVEPTSHVVDLVNVLRADEPRPGLSREQALAQAPGAAGSQAGSGAAQGAFSVPSPQADASA